MYKVFSKLYDKFMEFSDYGAWEKQVEELIKEGQPNGKTLLLDINMILWFHYLIL